MTSKKGHYTGRKIIPKDFDKPVTIGKIVGYTGTGIPIYELKQRGKKIGELNNVFIKKYLRERRMNRR